MASYIQVKQVFKLNLSTMFLVEYFVQREVTKKSYTKEAILMLSTERYQAKS